MRRTLFIRLFAMQLAPFLAAGLLARFCPRFFGWALLAAGVTYLSAVVLSIRDGAVLAGAGSIYERRKEGPLFWSYVGIQVALGILLVVCVAPMLMADENGG